MGIEGLGPENLSVPRDKGAFDLSAGVALPKRPPISDKYPDVGFSVEKSESPFREFLHDFGHIVRLDAPTGPVLTAVSISRHLLAQNPELRAEVAKLFRKCGIRPGADPSEPSLGLTTCPSSDDVRLECADPGTSFAFYIHNETGELHGVYVDDMHLHTLISPEDVDVLDTVLSYRDRHGAPILLDPREAAIAKKVGMGDPKMREQIDTDRDPLQCGDYYHIFHAHKVESWRAANRRLVLGMCRIAPDPYWNPAIKTHLRFGWEFLPGEDGKPIKVTVHGKDPRSSAYLQESGANARSTTGQSSDFTFTCAVLVLKPFSKLQDEILRLAPPIRKITIGDPESL